MILKGNLSQAGIIKL